MAPNQSSLKNFAFIITEKLDSHSVIVALLLSALFAFTIRLIPEILSIPWPTGYDTIGFARKISENYVWNSPSNLMETSPLFYIIATPFSLSSNVISLLKITAPVLYGLLAAAVFTFAFYALGWKRNKALVCSMVFALQLSALRLSWDLFRNELALIFMLLTLTVLFTFRGEKIQFALFCVLSALTSFSHEMVAALMLILIPAIFALKVWNKQLSWKQLTALIIAFSPSIAYSFYLAFWGLYAPIQGAVNYEVPIFFNYIGSGPYQYVTYIELIGEHARLFLLLFIPVLPLVFFSIKRKIVHVNVLTSVLLTLAFFPIISPYWAPAFSLRWMFMLAIPFSFYACDGLFHLYHSAHKLLAMKTCVALLFVSSLLFVMLPPDLSPIAPFLTDKTMQYMPSSLLSNTVSLGDMPGLLASLSYLNNVMDSNSLIVTHESLYEWARLKLQPGSNVVNSFKLNPATLTETISQSGYDIYTLGWTDSLRSWHGLTPPNSDFELVFSSGYMGVYEYQPKSNVSGPN